MEFIAQCLMGDRRSLAEYQNDQHVPYPLGQPLTAAELEPFVTREVLATFTAKVPLAQLARAEDTTLAEFIAAEWLGGHAALVSPEYRAVGATFDDFGQQYAGLVHLQVTCQLAKPGPR